VAGETLAAKEGGSGILANGELCRDCQACVLAWSLHHEGQCHPGLARLRIDKDMSRYRFSVRICRHCDDYPCLDVCPTAALRLDGRRVVLIVDEECLQCGACASECPYEAIFFHEASNRFVKCDLCADRPRGPLCVEVCPVGALCMTGGES